MASSESLPAALLLVSFLCTPLGARQVRTVALPNQPSRVSDRGFTKLGGVKELRDGRVILVDEIEKLVLLLTPDLASDRPIGREGAGPGEFRIPARLFSLIGDTSAVLDRPNGRLLVLGPDADPVGILNYENGFLAPEETDGRGRVYDSRRTGDSAAIIRWSPPSLMLDTVAFRASDNRRRVEGPGGVAFTAREDSDPFLTWPQWAVAPDGRIAFVYPEPYRVEIVTGDGTRVMGPEIEDARVRVTDEHKQLWREEHSRPRTQVVRFRNDDPTVYRTQTGLSYEPTHWPDFLPPFLPGAARFSPDGHLWVQRTTPAEDPPTFDVFNQNAIRIGQVTLPPGRRLLGFGRGTVYAVVRDELDLEYLERYTLNGADVGR